MQSMTIGQLAAAAGVNVETVRYYQRRNLLAVPARAVGSIGRYPQGALTRLRFIKRAQSLGLSLDDGQSCASAHHLGEVKLIEVRQRIQKLRVLEVVLQDLVSKCTTVKQEVSCPLIEALTHEDETTE